MKKIVNAYKLYSAISTDFHLRIEHAKSIIQMSSRIQNIYIKIGYLPLQEDIHYEDDFIILRIHEQFNLTNDEKLYWLIKETTTATISAQEQEDLMTVIRLYNF